jgi:hypothetical protein
MWVSVMDVVVVIKEAVGGLLTARPPLMRENVLVLLWFQHFPNIVLSALMASNSR